MGKYNYQSKPLDQNGRAHYTEEEKKTWSFLLHRQNDLIKTRASKEFIRGVELLNFNDDLPQYKEITSILNAHTGWGVEPVPALIQTQMFFDLLAKKRFPSANFIRMPDEIDYIEEPDIFHEIYGHCPLLTNQAYAEFMHQFGKMASKVDAKIQRRLFRLFWFTIEFGLIREDGLMKAYGGGILSSKSEVIYSVESTIPERKDLDPLIALLTPFRIDILQPIYFVINSYDDLFKLIDQNPVKLAERSMSLADFSPKFEKKKKSPPPELEAELSCLEGWSYNGDNKSIEKEFTFKSYLKNVSFVNAVAWLANRENHHPDLEVSFGRTLIKLTTHDENGVGKKDFELAKMINQL